MKDYKIQLARHLRQEQTSAEAALWDVLRNRNFQNLKFRRQHPLKGYIVDFYCDELELVIELDGGYHNTKEQKSKDENRDFHLSFLGHRVLRYQNDIVFNNLESVYKDIKLKQTQTAEHFEKAQIKKKNSKIDSKTSPFSAGEGLGMREITILSTKKLKPNQRDLLLGQGFSMVDYNAIAIEYLDFKMPKKTENIIFTSQNGVKGFLNKSQSAPFSVGSPYSYREGMRVFCVGQKTKALLEENGLKVTKTAQNSVKLGEFIINNHKNDQFHYFCGSERRDELPDILNTSEISLFEVKTYKTTLKQKKFNQKWDGILFFSPSGVESYFSVNKEELQAIPQQVQNGSPLFICIGETTANEVRKYFKNVVIANSTSVESVIAKTVKLLTIKK